MNKEKILRLANILEGLEHTSCIDDPGKFNMSIYAFTCGAPACVAGWAVALEEEDYNLNKATYSPIHEVGIIHERARDILDLSNAEARRLFVPTLFRRSRREITPREAARVLRRLAQTGIVQWES